MTRTTKKDVQESFTYFCRAAGVKVAKTYDDVGGYWLDYSPYGGYVVVKVSNNGGGLAEPFGARRRKAAEMQSTLNFAADALAIAKGER